MDDTNNLFHFTALAGTIYEYTTNDWSASTDYTPATTAGSISVGNVDLAAGQLQVRVKETQSTQAGLILSNSTAFNKVYAVTITVTKSDGTTPISGASITILPAEAGTHVTNSQGQVTVDLVNGAYTCTASAVSYAISPPLQLNVNGADITDAAISLTSPFAGISLSGTYKTVYEIGDAADWSGLIVTKTLANGDSAVIGSADYSVSGFSSTAAVTSQAITVSCTESGVTKTAGFTISVGKHPSPAAPTFVSADDIIDEFGFSAVIGKLYEYSTDSGLTWTTITAVGTTEKISVGNIDLSAGELKVRRAETEDTVAGAVLTNGS